MSLECLAILGSKNEPLYMCAPGASKDESATGLNIDSEHDVFGFLEADANGSGLSIRQEFMLHAALDRLEESLGSPKNFDLTKMQRGTKWMGSLLPMEDCEIYGYVTSSNIKILGLVKCDSVIPLTKRKDANIKILFTNIHDAFIEYTMNPFTPIRGKIEKPCSRFESQIRSAIQTYDDSLKE